MAELQTELESQIAELTAEAFEAFCEDISGMFGVEMACQQKEVCPETVEGLKKRFKKLTAVNVVHSEGSLQGTFHLIFDQEGLFTLGGMIVMMPEKTIMANRKDASAQLAASMVDAISEAGNLLVGSWDRVFREGIKGHGHFLQKLPAFVGKPWDNPKEKIDLPADEELLYVSYEMTVASYPAFYCGAIFPKTVLGGGSGQADEDVAPQDNSQDAQTAPQEKADVKEPEQKPVTAEATPAKEVEAKEKTPEAQAKETPAGNTESEQVQAKDARADKTESEQAQAKDAQADKTESKQAEAAEKIDSGKPKPKRRAAAKASRKKTNAKDAEEQPQTEQTAQANITEAAPQPAQTQTAALSETAPAKSENTQAGEISETIRRMAQSAAVLPGESSQPAVPQAGASAIPQGAVLGVSDELLSIRAADVMKHQVIWASPEETVQQVLARMQQYDTGYLMVGADGTLEGIVSRSDIAGALSPYLRCIFAKWRRPLDDATLKIKIKWIMSRPVRTVRPEAPLATVMENVCRFGGHAVPVVDEQGKVQGIVTVFDVFQNLLKTYAGVSTVGNAPPTLPLT